MSISIRALHVLTFRKLDGIIVNMSFFGGTCKEKNTYAYADFLSVALFSFVWSSRADESGM